MPILVHLLLLASFAGTQTPNTFGAKQFVRNIYAPYTSPANNYSSLGSFAHEQAIYSAGIMQLLKADARRTPKGDEGALDADPLCQCQDDDGMQLVEAKLTKTVGLRKDFSILLRFPGQQPTFTKLRLILTKGSDGWRVDDVIPATGCSMRQLLEPQHTTHKNKDATCQ